MQKKIQEASSMSGILFKKSPAMFKGFQKRYFVMRDSGNLLLYYKKKPTSSETKPQGIVPILSIENVATIKGNDLEFILKIPDRQFHLKAEDKETKAKWVEALSFLKEVKSKEQDDTNSPPKLTEKSSWSDLDKNTMNRIRLEDEKEILTRIQDKQDTKNEELMKCKGIWPYISKFDPATIEKYIMCGFLMKKGKIAKMTKAKRRWFFLISSVALDGEEGKQKPTSADIPSTFSFDTLYYFKYDTRGDTSNYIDKIPCDDVSDLKIMDMENDILEMFQVQKLPYGFTFNYKEREYHFFSDMLTEANNWIKAIECIKSRVKVHVEEVVEVVLYEGPLDKKSQNKILTGPAAWKEVTCTLKKNSLSWFGKEQEAGNQYVLLIYVKEVVGKNKSFEVIAQDVTYKFRASSIEMKDKWVKLIQDQVTSVKTVMEIPEVFELPPEIEEDDQQEQKLVKAESEDEESISDKFRRKFEISNGNQSQQKKSFVQKLFCCYGGGESDDDTNDRGF